MLVDLLLSHIHTFFSVFHFFRDCFLFDSKISAFKSTKPARIEMSELVERTWGGIGEEGTQTGMLSSLMHISYCSAPYI